MAQLPRQIACSAIASNLVMLDALRRSDQREISRRVLLFLALGDNLGALVDKTLHAFAGFCPDGFSKETEAFVQTFDLSFGLGEVSFEQLPKLIIACGL